MKCRMKLLIHSQTSTGQPLNFEKGYVISSRTSLGVWLRIHTYVVVNHPILLINWWYPWWRYYGPQRISPGNLHWVHGVWNIYFISLAQLNKIKPLLCYVAIQGISFETSLSEEHFVLQTLRYVLIRNIKLHQLHVYICIWRHVSDVWFLISWIWYLVFSNIKLLSCWTATVWIGE